MDDRIWKNVSILLGVVCALLIGVAGALMIVGHKGGAAAATPTTAASQAVSSAPSGTAGPSGGSPAGVTAPPGPTPSPGPISPATITFTPSAPCAIVASTAFFTARRIADDARAGGVALFESEAGQAAKV